MNGVLTTVACRVDDGVYSVRIHQFTEKPTLPPHDGVMESLTSLPTTTAV